MDGACSGYLVQGGRADACCSTADPACSPSCARCVDYADVDAVVISHLHADHILDLVPYASGPRYGPAAARPERLIARRARSRRSPGMCAATGMTADHIELAFDVTLYDPADMITLGG